jgi:hypothetical protein
MSEEAATAPSGPGTLTDAIWKAAQPPAVQKIMDMPSGTERDDQIRTLAAQGALLNGPVIGMRWSVVFQMKELIEVGKFVNREGWFPALGYPQLAGPPSIFGPQGPRPPWGILVSDDAADYPAWTGK